MANRDANISRLMAKYGAPIPAKKVSNNSVVKKVLPNQHWIKTVKELNRWKKTDDYKKWRKRQFAAQNAECYYCRKSLIGVKTNIEHITPKSRGGTNKLNNLVLSCWECNKIKGTKILSRKERKKYSKPVNRNKRLFGASRKVDSAQWDNELSWLITDRDS